MTNKKLSRRGRPELSDKEKRSVITQFRCTQKEREQLEHAAKINNMRLSDWIREKALIAAK